MLPDRSYLRHDYDRRTTSVLTWIMCAVVTGFILQNVFWRWFGARAGLGFDSAFELSIDGLRSGRVWTLFTYAFLHSTVNFLHIVGNMLGLYFLGRELLPLLGNARFVRLFFGAILLGGITWAAVNWGYGGAVIGASAGVAALLIVFAAINPNQPITLLLFFVLPVTLKPKYLAFGLLGLDLIGFLFWEITGSPSPMGYAHSAHLGGMAAGWIFFRYIHQREWRDPDSLGNARPGIELPRWLRRPPAPGTPKYRVDLSASAQTAAPPSPSSRTQLRAEIDRVLDKINSQGFSALTATEKRLLDDARDALSRK